MQTVVTLTLNPAVDKSAEIDQVVAEDKLRCQAVRYEPGGGGLNVARTLRELGGRAKALVALGGPDGELLRALLEREGLDHQALWVSGWTRQNLTVYERASGLQYRFGMPGPEWNQPEWAACLQALDALDPAPAYLVASGSLPPGAPEDGYGQIAELLGRKGVRVVVDTAGESLRRALAAGVYLIKPNLRELGQLAGEALQDDAQIQAAAVELVASGRCAAVLVSLGAAGALLVSGAGARRIAAPIVPILSKVGAGDSMVAGLVFQLASGASLERAARYGVAAGAAAVMTPGTTLCRRQDVERLDALMAKGS